MRSMELQTWDRFRDDDIFKVLFGLAWNLHWTYLNFVASLTNFVERKRTSSKDKQDFSISTTLISLNSI